MKISFSYSELFGEYSLIFFNGEKEYLYETYDAYFAKQVINTAKFSVGKAWNKVKKYGLKFK